MKITAIKQQVKLADRYSIYVDEKYAFSLSSGELLNSGLVPGQEITEQELVGLKDRSIIDKAYNRALDLISRRLRSQWELEDYLKRKDYAPEVSIEVIKKLREHGWLYDLRFAESWVRNRRLLKATSRRRLTQELRQKRVPDAIIEQALETDETDEREVLKDLVERKRKQSKYQDKMKLTQYLSRQGYNYDDIKNALEE